MTDTREKLSPLSVALHWVIGVTMIGMVFFGLWLADLPKGYPNKSDLTGLHKSIGMIVLVAATWRLWRRVLMGLPVNVGFYRVWERVSAKAIHVFLLFATLALPLSGVVWMIANTRPIAVFGVTVVPQLLTEKNQALVSFSRGTHDIMGKLLLLAVAFHIAGALKHHIVDRDGTLRRMLGARVTPTLPTTPV
jgi:cytochrome b561